MCHIRSLITDVTIRDVGQDYALKTENRQDIHNKFYTHVLSLLMCRLLITTADYTATYQLGEDMSQMRTCPIRLEHFYHFGSIDL